MQRRRYTETLAQLARIHHGINDSWRATAHKLTGYDDTTFNRILNDCQRTLKDDIKSAQVEQWQNKICLRRLYAGLTVEMAFTKQDYLTSAKVFSGKCHGYEIDADGM